METDEIHPAFQSFEQLDNLTGMGRCIIQSCKTDVLKGTASLVGEIILFQQGNDLCNRHLPLCRHQLPSLFGQGRMHRDSHMTLTLVEEPLQFAFDSHATHRNALRTPRIAIISSKDLRCTKHIIEIVHRLSLTHKHDVGQCLPFWQGIDLVQDLTRRETSLKALFARLTEQTVHLASHLTGYTEGGSVVLGDIHGLHKLTVSHREKILHRSIL